MPLIIPSNSQSASGFTIGQSIRFNDDDSAQMSRTPSSSSTSQRAFSISMWVKRGNLTSGNRGIISWEGANDNNELRLYFDDDALIWSYYPASNVANITTNRLFRDTSAWYNILVVSDTENAVSSERWKMYINGQRETSFSSSTFPSQNTDIALFSSTSYATRIGKARSSSTSTFDGYLAEIVVIDGQALDPSSFGEVNDSGIWVPKSVSGLTFGTNGFHIDGRDSSDLGDDESGNGNDFTTSGLASHDQMADSPTNNHAVMNPLDTHTTPNWTLSNGNLDVVWSGANYVNSLFSTLSMPSTGKWYFEIEFDAESGSIITNQTMRIGLMREDINAAYTQANSAVDLTNGSTTPEILVVLGNAGNAPQLKGMGNSINNVVGSMSAGDRINFARDGANLWVGRNGTYYNSGNPATGSNPTLSNLQLQGYRANMHFTNSDSSSITLKAYFGSDKSIGSGTGFNDTVPTGFKALNTVNLGEA